MSEEPVKWKIGQRALVALGAEGTPCEADEEVEKWVECNVTCSSLYGVQIVGWCCRNPRVGWWVSPDELKALRPFPSDVTVTEQTASHRCDCSIQDLLALGCGCGGI